MKKMIVIVALLCAGCEASTTNTVAPSNPDNRAMDEYNVEMMFNIDMTGTDLEIYSFESDGYKFFIVSKAGYSPAITSVPIQQPIKIGPEL